MRDRYLWWALLESKCVCFGSSVFPPPLNNKQANAIYSHRYLPTRHLIPTFHRTVCLHPTARPKHAVVGRCVFTDSEVLQNFVDVGGEVAYLQEAASDVYVARAWIFGFGFCFSTVSNPWGGG